MAVRRELVVLEVEENATRKFAEAAVAADLLDRKVKGLGGSTSSATRDLDKMGASTARSGSAFEKSTASIDKYSGRLSLLAQAAITLGPALIPIGAVAVPAVAGLAAQFGAAALAGGTALLAFQGVGTALKAVNTAALIPTTANLEKARAAMAQLSPAAQDFVRELRTLQPVLKDLSASAAGGFFPGLTQGMDALETKAPQFERIVGDIGSVLGNLSSEAGKALAGPEFLAFFDYIEREAPRILSELGHALGSVTHGLSELAVATDPLQQDFGSWMQRAAKGFDAWATGLSKTQGFHDFVTYVEQHGPEVADAVAAIGNALLQIVEAGAPLGGPTLKALTAVADVIAKLADSKAGPTLLATASALSILSRSQAAFGKLSETSWGKAVKGVDGFSARLEASRGPILRGGAAIAGLGLQISGLAGKSDLLNIASTTLTGAIAGPWGAAFGFGVGVLESFAGAQKGAATDAVTLTGTLDQQTGAITQNTAAYVAQQYASSGVLKAAQQLGLSLSDVTQAALGNQDALARVNAQAAVIQASLSGNVPKLVAFGDTWSTVKNAIGDTNGQLTAGQGKLKLIAGALGTTAKALDVAKSAAQAFSDEVQHLNDVLAKRASLRDYQAALDDFTKAVKDNGKTLDINTAKGRAVQAALDNIASTGIEAAQKLKQADRQPFLENLRKNLIDAREKIDGNKQAAQDYVNQLGILNQTSANPSIRIDTGNADRALYGVRSELNALDGRVVRSFVDVTTRHFSSGDPGLADAHGGGSVHARGGLAGTGPRSSRAFPGNLARRFATGGMAGGRHKPLFDGEGPRYYKRAYAHNYPFALHGPASWPWPYQTSLSSDALANKFEDWVFGNDIPFDVSAKIVDYDMRGFWKKKRPKSWNAGQHFPDTFKTPYDTTFSHESKYATADNPFYWKGDKLIDTRTGQVIIVSSGGSGQRVAARAGGGAIYGPGGPTDDLIPAWLSNGEYVVKAAAVDRYGEDFFHRLNAMAFSTGGSARLPSQGGSSGSSPYVLPYPLGALPVTDQSLLAYATAQQVATAATKDVTHNLTFLAASLKDLKAEIVAETKLRDKAKAALATVRSNESSLSSTVSGNFGLDSIFNAPSQPWAAGATANPTAAANALDATAQSYLANARALVKKKVSGPALQAILAQGPAVVASMAAMSQADLSGFVSSYNSASADIAKASSFAGSAVYGGQESKALSELKGIRHDLSVMQHAFHQESEAKKKHDALIAKEHAAAVAAGINHAAQTGKKNHR